MSAVRALSVGVIGAWRAPTVIANGLSALIAAPVAVASAAARTVDASLASRAAHAAVARLARVAPARWRNSCLYRSVAECVALRAIGLPARVVIGVGTSATADDVIAHAWVECDGVTCLSTRGQAELETMMVRGERTSPSRAATR